VNFSTKEIKARVLRIESGKNAGVAVLYGGIICEMAWFYRSHRED